MSALLAGAAVAAALAPAAASSAARTDRAPAASAVTLTQGQKVYRGSGNRSLGTLRLRRTAKLTWRHPRGGRFRLLTSASRNRRFPLVTTTFRSGTVRLRAGTYRGLQVQARGTWQITITTLKRA